VSEFWEKVNIINDEYSCWEWMFGCGSHGYGQFYLEKGKPLLVHRYSWELEHGHIPNGLYVLHKCDNKKCVRPSHLFLGTQKQNIADMFSKGRQHDRKSCTPKGDKNPTTKVSDAQVEEIRKIFIPGTRQKPGNAYELANKYGVTPQCIYQFARRKSRCHV
jgi:hypothetical protein